MRGQLRRYPGAFALLAITLLYNAAEGVAAIWAGISAGSIVLVSFGADSYLEVLAAGAVAWRLSFRDEEAGERAEARALRIVGFTFIALAAAVVFQSALSLSTREGAEESPAGIVILVASLVFMPLLATAKLRTAARAGLPALAAEAKETVACSYLSLTALLGLVATAIAGAWWIDPVAALLMVPWLIREGREGLRGEACFDGARLCWCRGCWFGFRACTDPA